MVRPEERPHPTRGYVRDMPMIPRYRVMIDNDFSGDPDDLFQLAHHLLSPSVEICGVIGSHLAPGDFLDPSGQSAENAVKAVNELLEIMGLSGRIPVFQGAPNGLADPTTPIKSEASLAIIAEAMKTADTKLFMACGAGLTDLASALIMRPEIADRMTLVWIGGPEYPDLTSPPYVTSGVEYNLNIDIHAARYVFNETNIPIWQVPRNVYRQCMVSLAELKERVESQGKLGHYLYHSLDRVFETTGISAETYVLGDQPLVLLTTLQTFYEADAASCESVYHDRPYLDREGRYREGDGGRQIRVFNKIDTRLMFEDLYAKLAGETRRKKRG